MWIPQKFNATTTTAIYNKWCPLTLLAFQLPDLVQHKQCPVLALAAFEVIQKLWRPMTTKINTFWLRRCTSCPTFGVKVRTQILWRVSLGLLRALEWTSMFINFPFMVPCVPLPNCCPLLDALHPMFASSVGLPAGHSLVHPCDMTWISCDAGGLHVNQQLPWTPHSWSSWLASKKQWNLLATNLSLSGQSKNDKNSSEQVVYRANHLQNRLLLPTAPVGIRAAQPCP